MIDRRNFLGSSFGFGLIPGLGPSGEHSCAAGSGSQDAPSEHPPSHEPQQRVSLTADEAVLAEYPHLSTLGVPRSWSLVRDGFHPVSPERVVIMPPGHRALRVSRFGNNLEDVKRRILSSERVVEGYGGKLPYGDEKLYANIAIVEFLCSYYRQFDWLDDWARRLCLREALCATGLDGFGLVHEFQANRDGQPNVVNPPVDWWLFLFPSGIDWQCWDDRPAYCLVAAVFERPAARIKLDVWSLMSRTIGFYREGDPFLRRRRAVMLANADRVTAARAFNCDVISSIKQELEHR